MARELFNPVELPRGPDFSHIAVATGSRLVFFAGQGAVDRELRIVGGDDLRAQTVAAMRNLEVALRHVGGTWDDVVHRIVYTTQPLEWETIVSAIDEVTGGVAHPAQTLVGVIGLGLPGALIEIEATASIG